MKNAAIAAGAALVLGAAAYANYRRFVPKPMALGGTKYPVEARDLTVDAGEHSLFGQLLVPCGIDGKLPTVIVSHGLNSNGKNAKVESVWHYIMPYNMIFRHTEARAWQMVDTMRKLVPLDVRQYFVEGKHHTLHPLRGTSVLTAAFRIEHWFSHVNGKHFRVTKDCIHCMRCVRNCPTDNIEFREGKIRFHDRCILCTRCSFNCPKDAIRIGLLNGWRVNGPYRFRPPAGQEPDKHANFCRRSYERYFQDAEQRIQKSEPGTVSK